MELVRNLRCGEPLGENDLMFERCIRRGDALVVLCGGEATRVLLPGRAQGDGRIGERIQVKVERTGSVVSAEVVGAGKVRLCEGGNGR